MRALFTAVPGVPDRVLDAASLAAPDVARGRRAVGQEVERKRKKGIRAAGPEAYAQRLDPARRRDAHGPRDLADDEAGGLRVGAAVGPEAPEGLREVEDPLDAAVGRDALREPVEPAPASSDTRQKHST